MSTGSVQSNAASAMALLGLNQYAPGNQRYNELFDATGMVRPHWANLMEALGAIGIEGLEATRRTAEGIIRENGITYNVYGDPRGIDRLWALDLLPVVLPQQEWNAIEAGIRQRVDLIGRIQRDIYGPRDLLNRGVLPPEFVLANPRFLRACHGWVPHREGYIVRYAADLVRGPDGAWQVYSDRTQAPSGVGYTLENRIVMSRAFPNIIGELQVRRLAGFFNHFRTVLRNLDPNGRENPTVILMTPGPHNETYFEHGYLARYLGIPMLEGGDLTVRDNRVFLKTVEGLQQVDVILRRVDDAWCDPLELRSDSTLGTPGLLQALREGSVSVCNAIGAGALEVPALKAVLPRVAQDLLGADLLLPSTPTYWGALPEHRENIAARLDGVALRPAFNAPSTMMGNVDQGDVDQRRRLWDNQPHNYVVHGDPMPSCVPALVGNQLKPRSLVLRVYAVHDVLNGTVEVLPGGLARFSDKDQLIDITMQQGSGSKDVWVTSDKTEDFVSLLSQENDPAHLVRSPANVSSRLAENLLWLGRYCERAEYSVRFLRYLLLQCADEEGLEGTAGLSRLMEAGAPILEPGEPDGTPATKAPIGEVYAIQRAVLKTLYDTEHASGITATLNAIRRAAWVVRERFSEDDWRILIGFIDNFLQRPARMRDLRNSIAALNQLVTGFAAFSGLITENMTKEPGQIFLDIGRRIERALNTTELLDHLLLKASKSDRTTLRSLLAICDSPMTYRSRYGATLQTAPVIDLLLSDETNPRAVSYQLTALAQHLRTLPRHGEPGLLNAEERILENLRAKVRVSDMNALAMPEASGKRVALHTLLEEISNDIPKFSDEISRRYFIHTAPSQQLGVTLGIVP